ncbi:recombinase family protein [Roseovarius sp. LXJ103]|uniref:recombinase family protein n=1 Tax=Roseovarius carneus TaxID=2853164 RepID=UPI000D6162EA|nr:recombinase family protein [Roseovarius carneus]MBZ8119750.1 recombinase family protein [Roseovarius carneus]PWE34644.1 DNA invertase [Pelagicola sp. LXJ1103]
MIVGYARTSTTEQEAGLSAQLRDLEAAGCDKVFREQVSSVDREARRELEAAIDYVRDGDTLIVTKLDRLARSVPHLLEVIDGLKAKGATLRILAMDIDTGTPTGKLMVSVLGSVAAFEREIMLERQREGIAKAKAEGKYKGRKPTAQAKSEEVLRLLGEGHGATEVAKLTCIARASVYRIKNGGDAAR